MVRRVIQRRTWMHTLTLTQCHMQNIQKLMLYIGFRFIGKCRGIAIKSEYRTLIECNVKKCVLFW